MARGKESLFGPDWNWPSTKNMFYPCQPVVAQHGYFVVVLRMLFWAQNEGLTKVGFGTILYVL
jgi:hypothetical protein